MPMLRRPLKRESSLLPSLQTKKSSISAGMGLISKDPVIIKNRITEKAQLLNSYKLQYYDEIIKIGLIKQARGDPDLEYHDEFNESGSKNDENCDKFRGVDPDNINEVMFGIDPPKMVHCHIKLLKEYNEIRDIALGLVGMISEQRGIRVKDVLEEMGVEIKD